MIKFSKKPSKLSQISIEKWICFEILDLKNFKILNIFKNTI
jgi:hypothetical protein